MRQTKTSQFVRDSKNIRKDKIRKEIEKQKQEKIQWCREQEADCVFVENEYISPANEERQLGKVMNTLDFENKLKTICPSLHFEYNIHNPQMKALYNIRKGVKNYLGAYHAGFMPEHSIVKIKEEIVWDPNATQMPLKKADLPKYELDPKKGIVWEEGAIRPGWKKIKKPAGELKRGWRTLLIKLVYENLLSPLQIEKTFGDPSSDFGKRAWSYHSGKKKGPEFAIPW